MSRPIPRPAPVTNATLGSDMKRDISLRRAAGKPRDGFPWPRFRPVITFLIGHLLWRPHTMKASIRTAIAGLGGLALLLIAAIAPAANNDVAVAVPGAADQDPNQALEIPQSSTQDSDQSPGTQEQSP